MTSIVQERKASGLDLTDRPIGEFNHAERLEALRREWRPLYQPRTPEAEWLFGQLVTSAVRVEVCQAHLIAVVKLSAQRARLVWQIDRMCDAEELALKLPRRPGAMTARLRRFRQGAELLLGRWRALQEVIERGDSWNEAQTSMALDLLGIAPETREENPWDAGDGALLELVEREIGSLERDIDGQLMILDDFERGAALDGQPFEIPAAIRALRREEAAALRTYQWARQALLGQSPPHAHEFEPDDDLDDEDDTPVDEIEESEFDEPEPAAVSRSACATSIASDRGNRRARRAARKRQRAARRR
ncbi:MAG: hypothetical protein U0794_11860 [Isosphaeraceae bacterium]